jgi:DNA topoisomerase-1
MAQAKYNAVHLTITAPALEPAKPLSYKHVLEIPVFLGWKKVASKELDGQCLASQQLFFFRSLSKETCSHVPFSSIDSTVVMRNRHSYFTEASLIQRLEELGIGRPSTFAMLVDTIQDRGYVKKMDLDGTQQECTDYKLVEQQVTKMVQIKIFGKEKQKLVIQPTGILCIEFLMQHFSNIFSYDYTKQLEEQLDGIVNGIGAEPWEELCRSCYLELSRLVKSIAIEKVEYALDNAHVLCFQQYGPTVKSIDTDGKVSYQSVKHDLQIDMEKVKQGQYTMEDLVETNGPRQLGEYQGHPLHLKTGRYGPYLEWSDKKQSVRDIGVNVSEITYENATAFLETIHLKLQETTATRPPPPPPSNKNILRALNSDTSIRSGKFGPYIFHQTSDMKKPEFYQYKKCPHDYKTCDTNALLTWIQDTYNKTK